MTDAGYSPEFIAAYRKRIFDYYQVLQRPGFEGPFDFTRMGTIPPVWISEDRELRVIVSIDTLKNPSRYRHHLERVRWDVVWIDEAHSVANRSAQRSQLAQVIAPNAGNVSITG